MIEPRTRHPFHMRDAIMAQPEAFVRIVERNEAEIERLAPELSSRGRLFLVGIGTSHHAALVGEHLMREYGGGLDARAMHSFDFALYGPRLTPEDGVVAISHRGTKGFTARALEKAREAGCRTALISGEGGAELGYGVVVYLLGRYPRLRELSGVRLLRMCYLADQTSPLITRHRRAVGMRQGPADGRTMPPVKSGLRRGGEPWATTTIESRVRASCPGRGTASSARGRRGRKTWAWRPPRSWEPR